MYAIEPKIGTSPHPSPFLRRPSHTTTTPTDPTTTTSHRHFGLLKTVSTTPASLTIIPNDSTTPVLAVGFSQTQLADFLYSCAVGKRRVSYLLRAGRGGEMLVKDVRVVEGVRVKEEGGGMVGRGDSVSVVGGFGALKHEGMMLEEEARRNARGEFRDRSGDVPLPAADRDEGVGEVGRVGRDLVEE